MTQQKSIENWLDSIIENGSEFVKTSKAMNNFGVTKRNVMNIHKALGEKGILRKEHKGAIGYWVLNTEPKKLKRIGAMLFDINYLENEKSNSIKSSPKKPDKMLSAKDNNLVLTKRGKEYLIDQEIYNADTLSKRFMACVKEIESVQKKINHLSFELNKCNESLMELNKQNESLRRLINLQ